MGERAHLVRLDPVLAPRLSNLLQIGVSRTTSVIFWPVDPEATQNHKTTLSYLPRGRFIQRLVRELDDYETPKDSGLLNPAGPKTTTALGALHEAARPKPKPPSGGIRLRTPRQLAAPVQTEGYSARNSYRAFFEVEGPLLTATLKELGAWLLGKEIKADLTTSGGGTCEARGRRVEWTITLGTSVSSNALHFEMTEATDAGPIFTTVLTADERLDNQGSWAFLHVYNDSNQRCGTPRIASALLKHLKVVDGERSLRSSPTTVRPEGVPDLLDTLRNRARRLPVQVVATDEWLPAGSRANLPKQVQQWTKSLAGQSHVVILDPEATRLFNEVMPPEFAATPWTLRTYRPGIALIGLLEARQQRVVSTDRLAKSVGWQIDRLLVGATRAITQQHPVPKEVRQVQALLARMDRASRTSRQSLLPPATRADQPELPFLDGDADTPALDAAGRGHTAAPTPITPPAPTGEDELAPEPEPAPIPVGLATDSRLRLIHDALLQTFDVTELTDDVVDEVLELLTDPGANAEMTQELERQLLQLQDDHEILLEVEADRRTITESLEAQLVDVHQQLQQRDRELRYLRQELSATEAAAAAYGYVDEDPLAGIDDILSVLDKAASLTYVVPTWDQDCALDIAEFDNFGTVPKIAWSALIEMERYCRAKAEEGYDKGFDHFVAERGESLTRSRVAMSETTQTMNRWGEERRFKVPDEVDPSGSVLMEAHIKLTQDGINSPRMHFYDATRITGKIYVGYLGRHLTNTKTANM
ncbi:hypothetical protein GCM10025789_05160 [Tessaracoccus lubricantis]|uniref:Uncharacterized protein n=1 Tax=Tessaracoccus lubricantis TaxID=545543 RepID=A0ABP9F0L2_9ACTN